MDKYIIMCGGEYKEFETPKHLSVIKGERLVDRTIRLLRENNVKDIYISSNNPIFDTCDAKRLINNNNNWIENKKGYWLDAFYPTEDKVRYIFGDVYFTEEAIKTIVNYKTDKDVLFGTGAAYNIWHYNWGEPFCYIVNHPKEFHKAIKEVKRLYDEGKTDRHPIVWELYRYLNNLDINKQQVLEDTYVVIDDGTIDIDNKERIKELNKRSE